MTWQQEVGPLSICLNSSTRRAVTVSCALFVLTSGALALTTDKFDTYYPDTFHNEINATYESLGVANVATWPTRTESAAGGVGSTDKFSAIPKVLYDTDQDDLLLELVNAIEEYRSTCFVLDAIITESDAFFCSWPWVDIQLSLEQMNFEDLTANQVIIVSKHAILAYRLAVEGPSRIGDAQLTCEFREIIPRVAYEQLQSLILPWAVMGDCAQIGAG